MDMCVGKKVQAILKPTSASTFHWDLLHLLCIGTVLGLVGGYLGFSLVFIGQVCSLRQSMLAPAIAIALPAKILISGDSAARPGHHK